MNTKRQCKTCSDLGHEKRDCSFHNPPAVKQMVEDLKYAKFTINNLRNLLWTMGENAGFTHAEFGSKLSDSELCIKVCDALIGKKEEQDKKVQKALDFAAAFIVKSNNLTGCPEGIQCNLDCPDPKDLLTCKQRMIQHFLEKAEKDA